MKVIKFTKNHSPYNEGEVASFSDEDADVRINAGVAELVKHHKIQPDRRVEDVYDADGNPTGGREVREVPDDLERNVELPPTDAGGKPKAEENMSDEEKARVVEYEKTGDADIANTAARNKALQGAPRDTAVKSAPKNK